MVEAKSDRLLGEKWAELIEQRQRKCDKAGIHFVQLIIPNKATLMPENFPEPLGSGMTTILHRLLEATPAANILCPIEKLRQPGLSEVVFRRNDSHLTVAGNAVFSDLLLEALGISAINVPCIEISKVNHVGDLGGKFKVPILEACCAQRLDMGLLDQANIYKTREMIAQGFNGTYQSFHNPDAPIKKSLLVIGNSFFERIPSWGMSPILCSLFENFQFYWKSDFEIVSTKASECDFIISQTCERFMNKLPVS